MIKKQKIEEIVMTVLASAIVDVPFAIVSTMVFFVVKDIWQELIGISTNEAIVFLICLLYYSRELDGKISKIWKGR